MPSKRKREAKEHGLPTQANSSGSKKQKKSHAENPAIHEPREIRNEAPSVDIMEKKLETKDGAIKLAQRLAKKERRRLERTAKGGSHEGFKVPEAERSEKDGNRKSEEQEVPMEEETLVSNRLRDTLKEAPTVHGAVKKPESQNEAVVLEQKLAKKERRRSERARRGSKTQMTEEKPADGRQQSVEQEVSGNQTRLERTITSDDSLGAPKKAITVTRSVLSLQSGYEAPEIARKLTKREKRKLKRAEKESKTQKTDKKEGDETRKPEKRDIPKKLKRLEERQLKKGQGPSEKPAKTLPIGELPALDETEKIGKKLSLKSAEKGPREKQKRNGERKPEKTQGILRKPIKDPVWQISDPIGGHMLDIDPVFSLDEKFLLIAYDASITVYSTSTSLQVRHLRTKKKESISAFALSAITLSQLYLSTITGAIEQWDWIEGLKLASWKLSSSIYCLATSKHSKDAGGRNEAVNGESANPGVFRAEAAQDKAASNEITRIDASKNDTARDLVYTIDRKGQGQWMLSAHRLEWGDDAAKTDVVTLLKYSEPLSAFKVLEGGRVIVAISGKELIVGKSNSAESSKVRDISYVWRIVECPEWVASIDVRIRPTGRSQTQAEKGGYLSEAVDVAVGGLKGSIHIYEDMLRKLVHKERVAKTGNDVDVTSRRLHWHRNVVLAIKWSLDGNYIISGGQETVLVLWQLETERRQELPHLGASIESIVVSPGGSSYSVRLADNSAMILSTSELRPTFSIAGIQIPSSRKSDGNELPFVPTVDAPFQGTKTTQGSPLPACISSSAGGQLLLAVPPSVISRQAVKNSQNASYLQTFDLGGGHQISRQALTRTNITTLNMGPESNTIEEPNVTLMQTSFDGQWLATIDEWMPPKRDVAALAFDQDRLREEQVFRREIHLKFWSWNGIIKVWELVSRVDNPHASQRGNPCDQGRVLDLATDHSMVNFATIGEDGIVKTWKPAIRRRNGLEVRSKDGKILGTWHCKHTISLDSAEPVAPKIVFGAKLAYSQDGSIMAAGLQSSIPCPIYTIDTSIGEVKSIQTGLYAGPLFGLGIVNKYLISLSQELCVYDLITDQRLYGIQLQSYNISPAKQSSMTHLAVDAGNGLFAVAVPEVGSSANKATVNSQVAVFDPTNPAPLLLAPLPHPVINLLSATRKKAFYAIDSAAEIRTLAPNQKVLSLPKDLALEDDKASRGLSDIFGEGKSAKTLENGVGKQAGLLISKFDSVTREPYVHEDDAVVVSQDRLAEVFDIGPAYAMPPVTELFDRVASLYNGRASS